MSRIVFVIALLLIAGCAATASSPNAWYDRKYNEYRYRGYVPPFRGEAARAAAAPQKQAVGVEEHMQRMQQQMDRIQRTHDPDERQRLMREHMQAMRDDAQAMRGCMMKQK